MNKRIQELADQCRIETYGANGELLTFGFDEEKFAELVVKECLSYAKDGDLDFMKFMIERTFGIKE